MYCSHFQFQAAQTEWSITLKTLKKTARTGKTYKVGYFRTSDPRQCYDVRKVPVSIHTHVGEKRITESEAAVFFGGGGGGWSMYPQGVDVHVRYYISHNDKQRSEKAYSILRSLCTAFPVHEINVYVQVTDGTV
jgi:hypothetical protein